MINIIKLQNGYKGVIRCDYDNKTEIEVTLDKYSFAELSAKAKDKGWLNFQLDGNWYNFSSNEAKEKFLKKNDKFRKEEVVLYDGDPYKLLKQLQSNPFGTTAGELLILSILKDELKEDYKKEIFEEACFLYNFNKNKEENSIDDLRLMEDVIKMSIANEGILPKNFLIKKKD